MEREGVMLKQTSGTAPSPTVPGEASEHAPPRRASDGRAWRRGAHLGSIITLMAVRSFIAR